VVHTVLFAQAATTRFDSLLKEGFNLHRQQEYARAVPKLEQARALQPADYFVNLLLGIDYLRLGDARRALTSLEAARKAQNNDPTVLGYLAEAYSAVEQFDKAAEALQFVATQPGSTDQDHLSLLKFYLRRFRAVSEELRSTTTGLAYSYRLHALVLRDRNDPKELETLLRASSLEPQLPGLETALGHMRLGEGQWREASEAFARARLQNPHDLNLMVGEGILAAHSSDWAKTELLLREVAHRSKHILQSALRDWPRTVSLPEDLRNRLSNTGGDSQIRSLSQGVEQDLQQQRWETLVDKLRWKANAPQESLWLGSALATLERFADAIVPLERARSEAKLRTEASYWLALCYARAAENHRRQLLGKGEESPFVHLVNGEVLLRLALDGPSAAAEYRKAIASFREDPAAWAGLAEAQMLAGDSRGARESGNRALGLDPRRFDALQTIGEAWIHERDYEAAIPPLQLALQAQPANLRVRLLLGTAYARAGHAREALPLLESLLTRGYPDEKGSCHYLLGGVLRRLGRTQDAEQAFQKAKRLSDSFSRSAHGVASEPR
jgi:tetratricopeptide (TPR) repeat protein